MSKIVEINQGRWGTEKSIALTLPDAWTVSESVFAESPALSREQIEAQVNAALESSLAPGTSLKGKRITLIADDLWRPTPVRPVLSAVVSFLIKHGAHNADVALVIACGTHARPHESQIQMKFGNASLGLKLMAHDCHSGNVFLCRTDSGTPLYVNRDVVTADVRILIGGVYPHPNAGFSGGEKMLVPGVCGFETIAFLHEMMRGASGRAGSTDTQFRREIAACAKRIGPSTLINACLNTKGDITALFCGASDTAFEQAERYARAQYRITILPPDTEIVLVEAFPFDMSYNLIADRALWPLEFHRRARQIVVIGECPQGIGSHELDYTTTTLIRRRLKQLLRGNFQGFAGIAPRLVRRFSCKTRLPAYTILSSSLRGDDMNAVTRNVRVVNDAEKLIEEWQERGKKGSCSVGIYRAAGLSYYGG